MSVPVTIGEALRGGSVPVPTLDGVIKLKIPAGTQSGQTLRVRGKGVERRGVAGDLYARIDVRLPDGLDPEMLDEVIDVLEQGYREHPRDGHFRDVA